MRGTLILSVYRYTLEVWQGSPFHQSMTDWLLELGAVKRTFGNQNLGSHREVYLAPTPRLVDETVTSRGHQVYEGVSQLITHSPSTGAPRIVDTDVFSGLLLPLPPYVESAWETPKTGDKSPYLRNIRDSLHLSLPTISSWRFSSYCFQLTDNVKKIYAYVTRLVYDGTISERRWGTTPKIEYEWKTWPIRFRVSPVQWKGFGQNSRRLSLKIGNPAIMLGERKVETVNPRH